MTQRPIIRRQKRFYYIDRIRINLVKEKYKVQKILPIKELKANCKSLHICSHKPEVIKYKRYYSKIEAVLPNEIFIKILNKDESKLGFIEHPKIISSKIYYIEIARDTFCSSFDEAVTVKFRKAKGYSKKYADDSHYHDGDLNDTIYLKNKNYRFVIYPCYSKINRKPCIHEEWRINCAYVIKKKTGIVKISDLIEFEVGEFFEREYEKYIYSSSVDEFKFMKWIYGLSRRKKLTRKQRNSLSLACQTYFEAYDIRKASRFIVHCNYTKKKIRSKPGPKTDYKKRWLKVNPHNYVIKSKY